MDDTQYERYTYTHDPEGGVNVHGWSTYPAHSVLAGQPQKVFLDAFASVEDALAAYPGATPSSKWTEPQVSLDHLPDEDTPAPGGMWPDDWTD